MGVWYFYSIDNNAMNARVFDFYHIHLHILQVLFVCDDVLGILLQSLLQLEEWKVCVKISVTFRDLCRCITFKHAQVLLNLEVFTKLLVKVLYVCGSCGTPLLTPHNIVWLVLITECHNSHKHCQSTLTTKLRTI